MIKKTSFFGSNMIRKYNNIPVQAKLALWITFCTVVQKSISLITTPIFTRVMDTTEYGRVSTYLSWLFIGSILTTFKLTAGVYNKGLSKYKDDQDGFCLTMQYTTSILTLLLYGIYLLFHKQINSFTNMSTFITSLMFLELFFFTSMGFWTVKEQYAFNYRHVVIATLFYAFLNPVLGLLFVLNTPYEYRGTARIISTVISQVIVGSIFYCINLKRGKFRFHWDYCKFAMLFNLPLIPHYFSEYILNQSDRIMIQKICDYSQVAFYSVAYNAGMLLTVITSSLNQAITPWLYQNLDKKNYKQISNVLISLSVIIMVPLIIFIALAPEAIFILAGEQYASSVYVVPPVAGSIVFLFLYTNFANIEFYYDYNKYTMYISLIGAVANIVLNLIFINLFGFVAAGYTTFACFLIYCVGHYLFVEYIMKKKNSIRLIDSKVMLLLFSVLLAVMIIMSLLYEFLLLRYAIVIIMLAFVIAFRKRIMDVLKPFIKKNK